LLRKMAADKICMIQGSFKEGLDQEVRDYKKIGVFIDYSYKSAKVLKRAFALSKSCSILHIVHILSTKLPYHNKPLVSLDPEYHQLLRQHAEELVEKAEKKAAEAGINYQVHLLEGDPAVEILKFAQEAKLDLIILGSKDKIGSAKNLGSVSNHVAAEAKCSVLIER